MKFKALLSPKQMFSLKGQRYKANEGYLVTDDKEVINYLKDAPYWSTEDKYPEPPKEVKKEAQKEPKKVIKKDKK